MIFAILPAILAIVFIALGSRATKLKLKRTDTPRRAAYAEWQQIEAAGWNRLAVEAGIWTFLCLIPFGLVLGLVIAPLMMIDAVRFGMKSRQSLRALGVSRREALRREVAFE